MRRKVLLAAAAIAFGWSSGASALPANNPITAGLVAAYEFNGNADDLSGNGNHGTVIGAVSTDDPLGNPNGAYSFAPSQARIEISPVFSSHQTEFTYAAWIKFPELGGILYGEYTTSGSTRNTWVVRTSVAAVDAYPDTGGANASVNLDLQGLTNQWLHLSMVRTGSQISAYVNGVLKGSSSIDESYAGPNPNFAAIGNRYNAFAGGWYGNQPGTYKFDGAIDDLYIYNRALSPTEVSTLYSAVPEPSTALLLGLGLAGLAARRRSLR